MGFFPSVVTSMRTRLYVLVTALPKGESKWRNNVPNAQNDLKSLTGHSGLFMTEQPAGLSLLMPLTSWASPGHLIPQNQIQRWHLYNISDNDEQIIPKFDDSVSVAGPHTVSWSLLYPLIKTGLPWVGLGFSFSCGFKIMYTEPRTQWQMSPKLLGDWAYFTQLCIPSVS